VLGGQLPALILTSLCCWQYKFHLVLRMEFVPPAQRGPEDGSKKLLLNIRNINYSGISLFPDWGEHSGTHRCLYAGHGRCVL
jgi:hypothetical protein